MTPELSVLVEIIHALILLHTANNSSSVKAGLVSWSVGFSKGNSYDLRYIVVHVRVSTRFTQIL